MKKSISVMAYTFSGFALQANLNNAQMVSLGKISNIDNLNIYIYFGIFSCSTYKSDNICINNGKQI